MKVTVQPTSPNAKPFVYFDVAGTSFRGNSQVLIITLENDVRITYVLANLLCWIIE